MFQRKKRLLNLNGIENPLKKKVYRYISYETFMTLVEGSFTRMSRISGREEHDPFENVLFKFPMISGGEHVGLSQLPRPYFAQCWTLTKESDLMWQL